MFLFRKKPVAPVRDGLIDVKKLIAAGDVQAHLRRAEDYFKSMSLTSGELRKPFMGAEATKLVPLLGVMLSHLEFYSGVRILDFGCGTGWLSQSLALMGAEVIAVDASPTALRLARENTHSRYPELKGRIRYVEFDGEHLDVGSEEIDRVVCMDSFHHVPNPAAIISEFGRVLAGDGRVVFSEPGENHSLSAESQHAMRTFGVIENDIVLADIWAMAQAAGFRQLKVAPYGTLPLLSLQEFDDLKSPVKARKTMGKLFRDVYSSLHAGGRQFVLMKEESARDSRFRDGLRCLLTAKTSSDGSLLEACIVATNSGTVIWRPSGETVGSVNAAFITRRGDDWDYEFRRYRPFSEPVHPGEQVCFRLVIDKSEFEERELYLDLVAEQVTWFGQNGRPPLRVF
jgi:2-polyprenyl-3-methyl-5-hydroxy-6-metoxy-1,4-benzoquinol methylase